MALAVLREKPKVSGQGEDGDKTVSFRVFLSDDERTEFKVECAKDKTTMSQQARELILNWLAEKQQPTQKQAKRRGQVGDEE